MRGKLLLYLSKKGTKIELPPSLLLRVVDGSSSKQVF